MTTLYLICGTMRTGSTLLQQMLRDAGLGDAREYLHGSMPRLATYSECVQRIMGPQRESSTIGWRVFWGHIWWQIEGPEAEFHSATPQAFLAELTDRVAARAQADTVKHIFLRRADYLRQAASEVRASAVNRWSRRADEPVHHVAMPRTVEAADRVRYLMAEFPKYNQRWRDYFADQGITPLELVYEDFTRDETAIRQTFWRVINFLGADVGHHTVTIPLKKQANGDVEDWIKWYEAL